LARKNSGAASTNHFFNFAVYYTSSKAVFNKLLSDINKILTFSKERGVKALLEDFGVLPVWEVRALFANGFGVVPAQRTGFLFTDGFGVVPAQGVCALEPC
jgi:hypothetical protein